MSQSKYAEHRRTLGLRGGSRRAVQKALESGRIHANAAGLIDAEQADIEWAANTEDAKAPQLELVSAPPAGSPLTAELGANPSPDGEIGDSPRPGSQAEQSALLTKARREKLEFEMAVSRGEFVPMREVEQAISERILTARNRLIALVEDIHEPAIRSLAMQKLLAILSDLSQCTSAEVQAA